MMDGLRRIGTFSETLISRTGRMCGWMLLILVFVQFAVVILRYLFGINYLWAQELALALHASIFMLAAGWSLLANQTCSD